MIVGRVPHATRTDLQSWDKAHTIKEYQTAIDAVKLMIDDEGEYLPTHTHTRTVSVGH